MQSALPNSIKITRSFRTSPEIIWQAWTDPQRVKMWFGSDPNGKVLNAYLDVKMDGTFEVSFVNSDMQGFTCYGIYREVHPYRKLLFTWGWKAQPEIEELVTVLLENTAEGTKMVFIHSNIDPRTAHNYEAGWNSTFDKLEKVLQNRSSSSE